MAYVNPVYPSSCPDPFILKFCGEYWCFATGWAPDGKAFPVLHSRDLVRWRSLGGAMEPLPGGAPEYWAPEVIYSNGRFYLYYSVGDGVRMSLRAAVATSPEGPYRDSGRLLCKEDFAIDAHVFEDEDGSRYLFYAKDFLEHTHIGTGIVADRMLDDLTLEGKARPVALPRYDWQVFDPNRLEKGGVRWHTVEGPFVLKHKGRYYLMFSGGNWQNVTYGVSYAVSDSMASDQEWTQLEHTEDLPLVLSTVPGQIIGPGHNSVVRGPDNRQLYCVYHRWSSAENARLLALDRLEWIGDRLTVLGPSTTPQQEPNLPRHPSFRVPKEWQQKDLTISGPGAGSAEMELESSCFALEVSLAARGTVPRDAPGAKYGIRLLAGPETVFQFGLNRSTLSASFRSEKTGECTFPLAADFDFTAWHLVRIELNGPRLDLQLDGRRCWRGEAGIVPERLALFSEGIPCSFTGCAITYGFEDIFFGHDGLPPEQLSWHPEAGKSGKWKIQDGELLHFDANLLNSVLVKEHHFRQYELVVNARFISGGLDSCYGFYPAFAQNSDSPLIRIEKREDRIRLAWYSQQGDGAWQFPDGFDRRRAQQFRFRKCKGQLQVYREAEALVSLRVPDGSTCAALYAHQASVAFDLVRLTAIVDQACIEGSQV